MANIASINRTGNSAMFMKPMHRLINTLTCLQKADEREDNKCLMKMFSCNNQCDYFNFIRLLFFFICLVPEYPNNLSANFVSD